MKQLILAAFGLFCGTTLFAQTTGCPTITLNSGQPEYKDGESATISATVKGTGDYTYNWSVSAGIISSGQGTSSITIDTKGQADYSITATVELGGAPRDCSTTQSATITVIPALKINAKTKKAPAKTKTVKKANV